MHCPVCDSQMITFSQENVSLTIERLGPVCLVNVPVVRCYGADHTTHLLPKRKAIFNQACQALTELQRPLSQQETVFLLSRLHISGPEYSRNLVTSNIQYHCWRHDTLELQSSDELLLHRIINKIKQVSSGTDKAAPNATKPMVLRLDVRTLIEPSTLDDCA